MAYGDYRRKGQYQPLTVIKLSCERVPVAFNSLVHPAIREEFLLRMLEYADVLEETLMIEKGL